MDFSAKLHEVFTRVFDSGTPVKFFSPGRVNLIGEHIDYNGGLVLPCALTMGTYGAIAKRADKAVTLISGNLAAPIQFDIDQLVYDKAHDWGNYPKGVLKQFVDRGHKLTGFDMYIIGNLPNGAGLSSSASLNALVATAVNQVFDLGVDQVTLAKICQLAEHFNGVNCGIMDPFACILGKKDHGILLDCNTLEYSYAPLELGKYQILIANTKYKRGLQDSKYNQRLAECNAALKDLQRAVKINQLCDLKPMEFEACKHVIDDDIHRNRAEHAVYENHRTKAAAQALAEGRLEDLYQLMEESHNSLRDLYDVVGDALEAMVSTTVKYADMNAHRILGTRMTGAGFGGCTVSIVHKDYTDDIISYVGKGYRKITGTDASFYIAEVAQGAGAMA